MHVLTAVMNLKCQVPFLQNSDMEAHRFLCKKEQHLALQPL